MRRLGRFQRKAVRYRVSPGGDAAMEANMAGTRRASGWRVVQAGVVQMGRQGPGERAADGVRGTVSVWGSVGR